MRSLANDDKEGKTRWETGNDKQRCDANREDTNHKVQGESNARLAGAPGSPQEEPTGDAEHQREARN
jgi:hypothetical protein